MLTFLPLEEINKMDQWEGSQLNEAKEVLAFELTQLIHGEEEAEKAKIASHALFAGGGDDSNMPTTKLTQDQLSDGEMNVIDLVLACEIASSRSEVRRLIQQNGLSIDDEKVKSVDAVVTRDQLIEGVKIRKGKKIFHKAIL
jgi:tyrosyl-tRNA synthetase